MDEFPRRTKEKQPFGAKRRLGHRLRIRKISKKQIVRNADLKEKRMVLLAEQVKQTGTSFCSAADAGWLHECFGNLVLDHVETRNKENADDYGNLQIICWGANSQKGSRRGLDFRTPEMREALTGLDNK